MLDCIWSISSYLRSSSTEQADSSSSQNLGLIAQKMEERDDYESLPSTGSPLVHMSAGAIAGLAEHCVMFPFDSVKTRLQSLCPCPEMKCPSLMRNLFTMIKREGWLRPLRGVNAVAWGACPAHAVYFTTYESMKKRFATSSNEFYNSCMYGLSGVFATAAHDAIMNPAEVVKQRMQMAFSPYGNSLECMRCIYRVEGLSAFYRSYATQLLMNVPFQAVHFMTYEFMQDLLNSNREYKPVSHLVAGGVAGGLAAAVTTPLDCIKTVLNTQQFPEILCDNRLLLKNAAPVSCRGVKDGIKLIYELRGVSGFFRGLRARIIFQMPATALSWSVYELFKYILREKEKLQILF